MQSQDPHLGFASTHEVTNQTPPLVDYNLFTSDTALRQAVIKYGGEWAEADLSQFGEWCGREETIHLGFLANKYRPEFESHSRTGHRVDQVTYHPAYHQLMERALSEGLHSAPWTAPRPGAHVARAAKYYLQAQVEAGHGCPITMTFASVPSLRLNASLATEWLPKVTASGYDPSNRPFFEKAQLTIGMGMTEKQGGSDVRANTSRAVPQGGNGSLQTYALVGHKWFMSAPMCDAFLMLAQAPGGLSCFLVPRWRPDGTKNPLEVQRLKDKSGNVSNASSEVEMRGAMGWLIGEEGRGVNAIIEMVSATRFDCMVGSSAGQRQAVAQAVHHATHRSAFGKSLINQPLMLNILADLQLEVEGSVALTLRMAQAFDQVGQTPQKLLLRLGSAVGKYWICKRTPHHAYEAMECLGGNGVIEHYMSARLYRDAPINAIWEGSGNIQALDVLRAVTKTPQVLEVWFDELRPSIGADRHLDEAIQTLKNETSRLQNLEYRARSIADLLALTMQGHLLIQGSENGVAEAFIASRLAESRTHNLGTLPEGMDTSKIIERAHPNAY